MEPLIVTACTDDYRERARELAASVEAKGLEILLIPFPDQGHRLDNCPQKPILLDGVLKRRLAEDKRQPLLWIDADGILVRCPPRQTLETLARTVDFAACRSRAGIGRRYCAGTLWLNTTPEAADFLAFWAKRCRRGQGSDEAQFQLAVETMGSSLRLADLGHGWGWLPPAGPRTEATIVVHRLSKKPRKMDVQRRPAAT